MRSYVFHYFAKKAPGLEQAIKTARLDKDPVTYLKESLLVAAIVTLFSFVALFVLLDAFGVPAGVPLLLSIVLFIILFYALLGRAQYSLMRAERLIESEIVSFVRFLILESKSEQSLYDALQNSSKNFPIIGIYLDEIVDKVKMGKTLEQSLSDAAEHSPSPHLRAVFWQLLNSLQTGADISESLRVQLEDIVETQKIKIEEYGRELNALSLFYMMVSIIIPTVGFTIVSAVLTFIGFPITLGILIALWVLLTLIQYLFLMIAARRRPAVEAY